MPNLEELKYKLPVAPLQIAVLDNAKALAMDIDKHLVEARKKEKGKFSNEPAMRGYLQDSYISKVRCPRFGTGEAKGIFDESVRGKDLFIITDVTNGNTGASRRR